MPEPFRGLLALIGACVFWGLSPIFYKALSHVPPLEVLVHRTIWSLLFFAGLLALQGRLQQLGAALGSRRAMTVVGLAALLIAVNWGLFIYSVQAGHVTESSLGYYIFPLVAVLLGVVVLRERLRRLQWLAIALATLAVTQLSVGLGAPPWISLTLALTFGCYGLIKKRLDLGPVVSVTAEVAVMTPLALLWLVWLHGSGQGAFGRDLWTSGLLALSGIVTALPLILFSFAARRVSMSTLGLVQYLNPTLQFICATLIFGEALTLHHALAFALIWLALGIYSWSSLAQEKARRKSAMTASAEAPL